jgi:hypothetical protein
VKAVRDVYPIMLLIAITIIVGLLLRFGRSSIGLVQATGNVLTKETQLLTLNTGESAGYFGP